MLKLTIDGQQVEVDQGTTVLNAARKAGIDIPTLCDHPQLTPYGGCRLCLVEVEGMRTLQPSCTLPASNGMVVQTNTQKVRDARKFVLTMIFSERNHFCPYCQVSGGDCELQNAAYEEDMTHWPIQPNWKPFPVDASHPFIVLEHNRCILCRRCVRACGELVGNFTLGFEERGAESALIADIGLPLGESSCIGCGTCVQVCPTGALIDRWSAYQGKEIEVDVTKTTCLGCSVGCSMEVMTRDGRLVRIEGDWEGEINDGVLCDVGRFHPMVEDRDRVQTPLVRKNGGLKASTWEEAMQAVSEKLKNLKGKKAGVVSTRLSLEALNAFTQISESLGINIVGSTEEGLATAAVKALLEKTKKPFESKIEEIKDADCYFLMGEDLTKDHQVISFFVKRALPMGAKLIQVSESETGFEHFADYSLRVDPEQTADFVSAVKGLVENGSDAEVKKAAAKFGLDSEMLTDVLTALKASEKPAVIIGTRYAFKDSYEALEAGVSLADKINAKVITTKGNINSLGALQLGLNNALDLKDAEVVIMATADENLSQQFMKNFDEIPFLVVLSSYISPMTASADVVLPVANWLEENGHFINMDGHILESKASLEAAEGIPSSYEALLDLAVRNGIEIKTNWRDSVGKNPSPVKISK